ncbi:MAG: response regulator transcription factor [Methylovirgula sp.]
MARVILDVSFHNAKATSNAGGWIIPKLSRQTSCGQVHISPHFESLKEVESQIDQMKADLEEIRSIAREQFSSAENAAVQPLHKAIGIVDDDEGVRGSFKFLLQTAGHYVETFAGAGDFLESDLSKFACLIFDQNMPGLSGLQLAERLRAEGVTTPIMLVTSAPSPTIVKRATEAGINLVLEKAPDADEILGFVSAPNPAPDMANALCLRLRGRGMKRLAPSRGVVTQLRPNSGGSGSRFYTA